MTKYIWSLLMILPVFPYAQTCGGLVYDADTKETLIGANITLKDTSGYLLKGTTTDIKGSYIIPCSMKDSVWMEVSFVGYETYKKFTDLRHADFIIFLTSNKHLKEVRIIHSATLEKLPGTGAIIDEEYIDETQPLGTQELLEQSPGINGFSDDGMGNSRMNIGIRGIPPRRSARVMVMEDGIPIQPAIYAYSSMYYNPPVERIENIEILKGSGSIEYGPQTMGGVINYITSKPRNDFGGLAKINIGNHGYFSSFVEIGGWGETDWKPELQLLYKRGNGFRDNNDFQQVNLTAKVRHHKDSSDHSWLIKANINYENSHATYTGLTEYSYATDPTFNPKDNDQFYVFRSSLDLIHNRYGKKGNKHENKIYTNYFDRDWWREYDIFYHADDFGNESAEPVDYLTNGDLIRAGNGTANFGIQRTFYVGGYEHKSTLNHSITDSIKGQFKFGARGHFETFDNIIQRGLDPTARVGTFLYVDPATGDTLFHGTNENYQTIALSLFASENFEFQNGLILNIGSRLESYYQIFHNRLDSLTPEYALTPVFLPGIGLNYPTRLGEFFTGIHRGFTPAGRSSLVSADTDGAGSVALKPEYSWNSELGFRRSGKVVNWEVAGYFLSIHNMLNVSRGVYVSNIDQIHSYGIENMLNLKTSQLKSFLPDFLVSYTLLKTEVVDGILEESNVINGPVSVNGKEMPYAPRHNLNLMIMKDFLDEKIQLKVGYRYVSKCYTDIENIEYTFNRGDTGPIPAYWILNAAAAWKINDQWRIDITGKNLTDEVYIGSRLHSSPGQKGASLSSGIIPGGRRQITIGITYNFDKQ
ncbi:MAG: TonB-dependent receptor [Flavobacteriales bacterium]|nr:TonB-dependent receptor [Flavobacteriales bacterium]